MRLAGTKANGLRKSEYPARPREFPAKKLGKRVGIAAVRPVRRRARRRRARWPVCPSGAQTALRPDKPGGGEERRPFAPLVLKPRSARTSRAGAKNGARLPLWCSNRTPPGQAGRGRRTAPAPFAPLVLKPRSARTSRAGAKNGARLPLWCSNRAPPGQAGRGRRTAPFAPLVLKPRSARTSRAGAKNGALCPSGAQTALRPDKAAGVVHSPQTP